MEHGFTEKEQELYDEIIKRLNNDIYDTRKKMSIICLIDQLIEELIGGELEW